MKPVPCPRPPGWSPPSWPPKQGRRASGHRGSFGQNLQAPPSSGQACRATPGPEGVARADASHEGNTRLPESHSLWSGKAPEALLACGRNEQQGHFPLVRPAREGLAKPSRSRVMDRAVVGPGPGPPGIAGTAPGEPVWQLEGTDWFFSFGSWGFTSTV